MAELDFKSRSVLSTTMQDGLFVFEGVENMGRFGCQQSNTGNRGEAEHLQIR